MQLKGWIIGICLAIMTHAALLTQPTYIDDVELLKELDIDPIFLQDPIFKRLKIELTTRKREHFLRMLRRGKAYIPTLRKKLAQHGVPQLFLYMAMAESHFDAHASSSAKAVGLWQFIPTTARLYGLRIDRYVDERKDPVRSTDAAIAYLKHLYALFGKWYLAALAYNSGEGRVLQAIKRAGSDDLRYLLDEKKHYLPKESRNYLRKIVSLSLVASNPELSFTRSELLYVRADSNKRLVRVKVNGGEALSHIAKQIGMTVRQLKAINPQFRYDFTPPRKMAQINIPSDRLATFRRNYKPGNQRKIYLVHHVKKGDTLYQIARRYGIDHVVIATFNKIKRNIIYPGQPLIVPIPKGSLYYYRVKRGDSIYAIAKRFGVKVAVIKLRNGLKSDRLQIGDQLVIPN